MGRSRDVVERLYKAFGAGDADAALAIMSPEIAWNEAEGHPYADHNPYTSPQAVASGVFARVAADWDDFLVTIHDMIEAEDKVVVQARYTGTCKRTGQRLDAQTAHIFVVGGDDRIISFQQYADTLQFARIAAAHERNDNDK